MRLLRQAVEDWLKEAEQLFKPEDAQDNKWMRGIAFKCPRCGNVQTMDDFKKRGLDHNLAYKNCLGRHDKSIGCDWAAYGLLGTLGKGRIVISNGVEQEVFDFAK